MRDLMKKTGLLLIASFVCASCVGGLVWGDEGPSENIAPDTEPKCATILHEYCEGAEDNGGETIKRILVFAISILSVGIGVLGTIGIIICGYLIMTAGANEAQVTQAKRRLIDIVIGIALWAAGALLIILLVPDSEAPNYVNSGAIVKLKEIE